MAIQSKQLTDQDFDKVYDEQADYVYSLSRRLSKTNSDAEDLFQEAFLKAFRFFPKFRGGSLRGWLRKIVVTTNISRHRGKDKQPTVPFDQYEGWKESIPDDSAGPEQLAEERERRQQLQSALEQLGEDARRMIVLRELEGLDYNEIAETLEIPKGTVRSRLSRAREALRRVLEQADG